MKGLILNAHRLCWLQCGFAKSLTNAICVTNMLGNWVQRSTTYAVCFRGLNWSLFMRRQQKYWFIVILISHKSKCGQQLKTRTYSFWYCVNSMNNGKNCCHFSYIFIIKLFNVLKCSIKVNLDLNTHKITRFCLGGLRHSVDKLQQLFAFTLLDELFYYISVE